MSPKKAKAPVACACLRLFDTTAGMRVHQRTCEVEKARSDAFAKAVDAGLRGDDARKAADRVAREARGDDLLAMPAREVRAHLTQPDDDDAILVQVELRIDPASWARDYGLDPSNIPVLEQDAVDRVRQALRNVSRLDSVSSVNVRAI